jgi:hypothetical protein
LWNVDDAVRAGRDDLARLQRHAFAIAAGGEKIRQPVERPQRMSIRMPALAGYQRSVGAVDDDRERVERKSVRIG